MRTLRKDARLRLKLEGERLELREGLAHHEHAEVANIGLGNHMADDGTEAFEQAASLALRRNQERTLERIEKALVRMEAGTYGLCECCGSEIDFARLKALPHATLCIDCQPRAER
jgi:RNA polymerase-binding protein DksA